jgi:hypothetical protein
MGSVLLPNSDFVRSIHVGGRVRCFFLLNVPSEAWALTAGQLETSDTIIVKGIVVGFEDGVIISAYCNRQCEQLLHIFLSIFCSVVVWS